MPKVTGTPKVKFNLVSYKLDPSYIVLFFHYHGKTLRTSTGEQCSPKYWDKERQRVRLDKKHPHHSEINNTLDRIAVKVLEIYTDFNLGADITPEQFKAELSYRMKWKPRPAAASPATVPLFTFIEDIYLPEKKAQPRGTWKILQTVFGHLEDYANERTGGSLDYQDIDYAFFSAFKAWLYKAPRSHSINYASKVIEVLKQFMGEAQRRKYHDKTDYQGFSIKKVKTTKLALSFEELETLYRLDLSGNERLERVRDLFLIGAFTGLRFSDFTRIRLEHIEAMEGTQVLTIVAQKTGEPVSIPLMPIAAALLKKYDYSPPGISNQKMNAYLKELGQLAGMQGKMIITTTQGGTRREVDTQKWEMLTSHVARRSFATNFYRAGIPAAQLMQITGHATERQFMAYIKITGKQNALDLAESMAGIASNLRKIS